MNKESEYIPIDSIREIQSNLRLDQLDKKFIDKDGNRFVVRFGKESKKLEIFQIQKRTDLKPESIKATIASKQEEEDWMKQENSYVDSYSEQKMKDQIRKADKEELESRFKQEDSDELLGDIDLNIEDTHSLNKKSLDNSLVNPVSIQDEKRYITDFLKCMEKNKDRVLSTLSNVKNSKIFELTGDPSENSNIVSNFNREFDSEIFRIQENLQGRFKEITYFPRSITHYSMSYTLAQKDFLSLLETDKIRLDYILRWEMQEPSLLLLKKFAKMVTSLLSVLNTKEEEQIKTLTFQQQTLFRDSKTAIMYCLNDLDFLKRSIERWIQSAV